MRDIQEKGIENIITSKMNNNFKNDINMYIDILTEKKDLDHKGLTSSDVFNIGYFFGEKT